MLKRYLWAMVIGLVLLGGAWDSAAGTAYDLTKLKSLCVATEPLTAIEKQDLALSYEAIQNHVYVWLKSKLPRLGRIGQFTGTWTGVCASDAPTLMVITNLGVSSAGGRKIGFYGHIIIKVVRTTLWESGMAGSGIAYFDTTILTGPMDRARAAVNDELEDLLTDFAAEYYKAGNP